mgnify:CR=1 FL=1
MSDNYTRDRGKSNKDKEKIGIELPLIVKKSNSLHDDLDAIRDEDLQQFLKEQSE